MSAELSSEVKIFIIQSLACFDRPSKVMKAVKEEFDLVVTRQAVHWYDADRKGGEEIPEQWRQMFAAARKRFLDETADIGIANRAVRLRKLDQIAAKAEEVGNHMVVLAACEAAAKEMGGAYSNKRHHELTGKDGKDLQGAGTVVVIPDNGRGDYDFSQMSTDALVKVYQDVAAGRSTLTKATPEPTSEAPE
jgi:hypothetical protein